MFAQKRLAGNSVIVECHACDLEVTNERTICGGGNFSFTASSLSVVMVGDFFSFVLYV